MSIKKRGSPFVAALAALNFLLFSASAPVSAGSAAADPVAAIRLAGRTATVGQLQRDPWVMLAAAQILGRVVSMPAAAPALACSELTTAVPSGQWQTILSLPRIIAEAMAWSGWDRAAVMATANRINGAVSTAIGGDRHRLAAGTALRCVVPGTIRALGIAGVDGDVRVAVRDHEGRDTAPDPEAAGSYQWLFAVRGLVLDLVNDGTGTAIVIIRTQ
ncbi:MAG: hypothetical protein P4N41_22535 [Negativicutes bacterium]|nr:hypothetical protein [Negativicutes bacterium]